MVKVLATKITSHTNTPLGAYCTRCGIKTSQTYRGRCRDCRAVECPNGHLLTPENSTPRENRAPECLACKTRRHTIKHSYTLTPTTMHTRIREARQKLAAEATTLGQVDGHPVLDIHHNASRAYGTITILNTPEQAAA
ncbi:hypothetical protein FYJ24_09510 [Actinomycetaceae bacterium WB03_NA08]|uniref:Uncharacterized protein n=1 Tax=Scrofimicrobium canadense TaxID=2652290 RepID=A0A6N7W9R9_9ACTO|nr:hypothetical protein [Scrofimicrobium canadense]MSS84996.1 hypothetical protein [Scrofimicrobium canadense]